MAIWLLALTAPLAGLLGLILLLGPWGTQEHMEPAAHVLAVDSDNPSDA